MDKLTLNGEVVCRLIAEAGLLRTEFATKAGIAFPTASRVFASRPVGVRVARQVAAALNVPLRRLIVCEEAAQPAAATAVTAATA